MKKYLAIILICSAALWWRWQQRIEQSSAISPRPEASTSFTPTQHTIAPIAPTPVAREFKDRTLDKLREQSEDPNFLPFDNEGNVYIENVAIDGEYAIVYGDVLVGLAQDIIELELNGDSLRLAPPKLWPKGIVPYLIASHIPPEQKREIKIAIKTLNAKTVAKFVEREKQEDYVVFKSGGQHCYSNVGRLGGEQFIVLGADCMHPQILHEMLHTLGLYHEQSRIDRDEHVMILWENIEERYHEQFKKMPPLHFSIEDSHFDLESIMMYPPLAFSRDSREPSILTLDGEFYSPMQSLSPGDIKKLELLYGKKSD